MWVFFYHEEFFLFILNPTLDPKSMHMKFVSFTLSYLTICRGQKDKYIGQVMKSSWPNQEASDSFFLNFKFFI